MYVFTVLAERVRYFVWDYINFANLHFANLTQKTFNLPNLHFLSTLFFSIFGLRMGDFGVIIVTLMKVSYSIYFLSENVL